MYEACVSLYVSLCPMGEWLTLGSLQSVERVAPLRFSSKRFYACFDEYQF